MSKKCLSAAVALLSAAAVTWVLLLVLRNATTPVVHAQGPDGYATYYVAPGGECGGETPCFSTVQAAVDAADDPADVIKVAAGTYTGTQGRPAPAGYFNPPAGGIITQVVYISKPVTLRGGYTVTHWTTPYPITQPTTLDAGGQGRVLYVSDKITATIEGLQITGGDGEGLGGREGIVGPGHGGGVYVLTSTVAFVDNRVFGNTADCGGGFFLHSSTATLTGNAVFSNSCSMDGGGLIALYSDVILSHNTISTNTAGIGGGLEVPCPYSILLIIPQNI